MRNYTEREIHLLSSITNQMAILIENRTLYERMKKKNEELQRHKQDLKEHLEEVNRANIELERLNAAKNLFVGMASHELKTPLTSIKGGLQFLIHYSGLSTTPEQKGLMEAVYEGVIQLKGIVDELLCISRIEAKGFVLKKRLVNFPAICEEVRHALLIPLSKRDIEVTIDADSCFIEADEGFCQLVIRNLLENAMKFTPDGGRIAIAGSLVTRNEILTNGELRHFYPEFPANIDVFDVFYRFDIADTGVGIPEDERVRIFEKFYGVGDIANHSSGCGYLSKGAGLGLSIVKGILDAHGGMVWVEPGYDGIGSVFSLLIPLDSTSMISRCE
jgi:signal transduction histidine kinase